MKKAVQDDGDAGSVGGAVLEILRSFDCYERDAGEQITALTALCAVLGRGLVLGGRIQRADLQAAARSIREQLPPGHSGQDVIDRFLDML